MVVRVIEAKEEYLIDRKFIVGVVITDDWGHKNESRHSCKKHYL